MEFIDTHAHINHPQFNLCWQEVLKRAKSQGIVAVINVGYDLSSSERAVFQCGETLPDSAKLFAAIGVHPHETKSWNDEVAEKLRQLAKSHQVVAIGEIGLDFHYDLSSMDVQRRVFAEQLELACQLDLPIMLHIRDAYFETLDIVSKFGKPLRGVVHCFTGTWSDAQAWLELGFYIGITGILTFLRKSDRVKEVACKVLLDRLLLETDAPYLAPAPYRGSRNEPSHLTLIAQAIAQMRNLSVEDLANQTAQNAKILFGLS